MCSPSYYRSLNDSLISEWSVWIITYRITKQMGISRRIREIISPVILVHPRSFKKTATVSPAINGFPFLSIITTAWFFGKLHHLLSQTGYTCGQGFFRTFRQNGRFQRLIIPVTSKLTAPQSTKIDIIVTPSHRPIITPRIRIGLMCILKSQRNCFAQKLLHHHK